MRNSMQFAVVLFFLVVLAMITLMGGDTAEHSAVGGPEADVSLFGDEYRGGPVRRAGAYCNLRHGLGRVASTRPTLWPVTNPAPRRPRTRPTTPRPRTRPDPMPTVVTHVVQRGETLWDIALAYGIDVDTIVAANDIVRHQPPAGG